MHDKEIHRRNAVDWSTLPLGTTPAKELVALSLSADAHTVVAGFTGSMKSVLLSRLAVSALSRGHQVVIIDSVALDASFPRQWLSGQASTVPDAAAVIYDLLEELSRRNAVLRNAGAGSWIELSTEAREQNSIVPLTLIFDGDGERALGHEDEEEDFSLFPKLRKSFTSDKEVVWLGLQKLTRDACRVGIHVVFTAQRILPTTMPDKLRSHFSATVLVLGRFDKPSSQYLSILLGRNGPEVKKLLQRQCLRPPGVAVISDSSGLREFHVGFIDHGEVPRILEVLNIPMPKKQYGWS